MWEQLSFAFASGTGNLNKEHGARKRELRVWGRAELPRCEWRQTAIKNWFITELVREENPAGSSTSAKQWMRDGRTSVHRNQRWERGGKSSQRKKPSQTAAVWSPGCPTPCSNAAQHLGGSGQAPALCPGLAEVLLLLPCGSWAVPALGLPFRRVNLTWLHCQEALSRVEGTQGLLSTQDSSLGPFLLELLHAGSKSKPFPRGLMQFVARVTMAELARHCDWALQRWGRSNMMQLMVTACTHEFNGTKSLNLSFRHCLVTTIFLITAL